MYCLVVIQRYWPTFHGGISLSGEIGWLVTVESLWIHLRKDSRKRQEGNRSYPAPAVPWMPASPGRSTGINFRFVNARNGTNADQPLAGTLIALST